MRRREEKKKKKKTLDCSGVSGDGRISQFSTCRSRVSRGVHQPALPQLSLIIIIIFIIIRTIIIIIWPVRSRLLHSLSLSLSLSSPCTWGDSERITRLTNATRGADRNGVTTLGQSEPSISVVIKGTCSLLKLLVIVQNKSRTTAKYNHLVRDPVGDSGPYLMDASK